MKLEWIKVLAVTSALIVGYGSYWLTHRPDGVVEQAAEAVLKANGVEIDFSPEEN